MASSCGGASGEVVDKGDGREVERWAVLRVSSPWAKVKEWRMERAVRC